MMMTLSLYGACWAACDPPLINLGRFGHFWEAVSAACVVAASIDPRAIYTIDGCDEIKPRDLISRITAPVTIPPDGRALAAMHDRQVHDQGREDGDGPGDLGLSPETYLAWPWRDSVWAERDTLPHIDVAIGKRTFALSPMREPLGIVESVSADGVVTGRFTDAGKAALRDLGISPKDEA